jgi:hypothetical protein
MKAWFTWLEEDLYELMCVCSSSALAARRFSTQPSHNRLPATITLGSPACPTGWPFKLMNSSSARSAARAPSRCCVTRTT